MKATNFLRAGLVLALGAFCSLAALAKEPADRQGTKGATLSKGAGSPVYAVLNINNVTTWLRYDGHSNHSPSADDGFYYPRGTGSAIYQDCIVWGGKLYTNAGMTTAAPRQLVRVGGGTYGIGTRAGKILNPSLGPAVGTGIEDQATASVRIYRIRRDYFTMSDADVARDAASVNEIGVTAVTTTQMTNVRNQYATDWMNWPVSKGAPFIDRNGNGVYDATAGANTPATYFPFNTDPLAGPVFTADSIIAQGKDEPGVAGGDPNSPADQVIWTVYNDLNVSTALSFEGAEPFGLEVQKTVWGYKRTDALGNLYFNRYKLINKGGVDTSAATGDQFGAFWIDSMYICQWSDPDLGNAGDDLLGSDSVRSMGYCYNGNANDAEYKGFGLPPPAVGYDFLAGPTYPSVGDSAVFNLKRVYNKKNRGMSSFSYFSAGSPYSDPPTGSANYLAGTGRWWKMLRGFAPLGDLTTADQPYAHPTSQITKFPLSGDPVARTGFLDGLGTAYSFAAGDRRLLCTTGPFQMAPGDTQEVYVGVVAGIGADRFTSIAVMKFNDQFVQNTFDALFQVPRAPAPPDVKVAELDGQVILEWASNATRVKDVETKVNNPGSYIFEGYNVYQLPSRSARLTEGKRLATYDLVTDPTVILDQQFDEASGQILTLPVQYGSNSGLKREFVFDRDHLLDINKLYNGQEYYLVVTAYSRATVPGYLPASLESDPVVLTVQPKVTFGRTFPAGYLDTIKTVTHTGVSDGAAVPTIVNPTAMTGASYRIGFRANNTWWLAKGSDTLLTNQSNQTGDDESPLAEGIRWRVVGAPNDAKDFQHVANPSGAINPPTYASFSTFNSWGFPDPNPSRGGAPITDWGTGRWGIHTGGAGAAGDESYEGRFKPRVFRSSPYSGTSNFLRFVPKDYEIRFTAAGGLGYLAFTTGGIIQVPFEIWCIGSNTPTNTSDDYRMIPWINDADGNNAFNLMAIDHALSGSDNDPYTDWIYWMEPINKAAGQVGYNQFVADTATYDTDVSGAFPYPAQSGTGDEVMARVVLVNVNGGSVSAVPFAPNSTMPPTGNVIRIISTKPNTVSDMFDITTSSYYAAATAEGEKLSADKVGVFPNPYYAFNSAETNRFQRFVTFNNLPPVAKIRIFNLAGQLVRTIDKNDPSQFLRWNIMNQAGFPVASGMYIAHVEMTLPADGSTVTKVLKLAVIQEQEILNTY